jgi:hypothetical protein
MGRPTDYTPKFAAEIYERREGGEPLQTICRKTDGMPPTPLSGAMPPPIGRNGTTYDDPDDGARPPGRPSAG